MAVKETHVDTPWHPDKNANRPEAPFGDLVPSEEKCLLGRQHAAATGSAGPLDRSSLEPCSLRLAHHQRLYRDT